MRVRLRDAYPDPVAFYAERYPNGYDHTVWPDHVERVNATVRFAWENVLPESIADLSAGSYGFIARDLQSRTDTLDRPIWLSDLLRIEGHADHGPVEETLGRIPLVDLLICSETLEHLDDPEAFLRRAREKCSRLLVTTPEGETDPDQNPEHYWGWDSDGVMDLLITCGWRPFAHQLFTPSCGPYTFQMWICR